MQIVFKLHATLTDHLPRGADGRKPPYNQLQIEVPDDCNVQTVIDRFNLPALVTVRSGVIGSGSTRAVDVWGLKSVSCTVISRDAAPAARLVPRVREV